MEGLVAQAISTKMHGDEDFGAEILKSLESFFWVEVIFTELKAVVSADREKGDLRVEFFSDLLKSRKIA